MKLDTLIKSLDRISKEISQLREEMWADPNATSFTPEGKRRPKKHFEGLNKVTFHLSCAIDSLNLAGVKAEEYPNTFPDRLSE